MERSSAVTPMNWELIQTPTMGESTLFARFVVPVRNANTVPSIFYGVILANRAKVGSVFMAREITPKIVSVRTMNRMSLIPISVFHLQAKAYWESDETIENMVE